MRNARTEAKMEVIEDLQKEIAAKETSDPMASFAMSMMAMMAITEYEKKVDAKMGDITALLDTLGNTITEGGSPLTDTLTYQNLRKRLASESE